MKTNIRMFIITIIFLIAVCATASAEEINLVWTHDTPALVNEYKVYQKVYPDGEFIQVWSGQNMNLVLDSIENVKCGYTVTACNEYGSSLPSQEVFYIALSSPDPIVITGQPKTITIEFE